MPIQDELRLFKLLSANGYIPEDMFELTDEDRQSGITDVKEKLELDIPSIMSENYAEFDVYGQPVIIFLNEDGVADYVKDKLGSLGDPDEVFNLLSEFSNNFKDVLPLWGIKTVVDSPEGYSMAEAPTTNYEHSRLSSLKIAAAVKKTAAGTGIGPYRRGKVLTDVTVVEPGQLLAHESIIYKVTNLVKVTQTFQDKFYAVFVNPDNPVEKAKAADEEFVVYPTDLERGEYYIALEPSPEGTAPAAGDASGTGTKPVPAVPVEDKQPTPGKDEKAEAPAEPAEEPAAEAVPAGKGASKIVRAGVTIEQVGTIEDIQDRPELELVNVDTDVQALKDSLGDSADVAEFDGFFVKVGEGEYDEIYGFYGSVPDLDKALFKITEGGVEATYAAADKEPEKYISVSTGVPQAHLAGDPEDQESRVWGVIYQGLSLMATSTDKNKALKVWQQYFEDEKPIYWDGDLGQFVSEVDAALEGQPTETPSIYTTFEIISEESAAEGDVEDRGWVDEEGESMEPDEYEQAEGITAVDKAVEFLKDHSASEPSASHSDPTSGYNIWYTQYDYNEDFKTGDRENRSYHLYGFTPEQRHEVFTRMMGKQAALKTAAVTEGDWVSVTTQPGDEWADSGIPELIGVVAAEFDNECVIEIGPDQQFTVERSRVQPFDFGDEPVVASAVTAIESPVRKTLDYGQTKQAGQDEPATAGEARYDNPAKQDSVTHETPLGHFMDTDGAPEPAADALDHALDYLEGEHSTWLDVEHDGPTHDYTIINRKIGKPVATLALEGEQVLMKSLADDRQAPASDVYEIVKFVEEANKNATGNKPEAAAGDEFELEPEREFEGEMAVGGSAHSLVSTLLANFETLGSAPGGEGDNGDAYNMDVDRNFTGINEDEVTAAVNEYLIGKSVSFASFADFAGFVEDMYGIAKQASAVIESAWHDDDAQAIVGFISKNATKDILN